MAVPWPTSLPIAPQRHSWSESPRPNVVAFQPEIPVAPMTRRVSTAAGYGPIG